MTLHLVIHRPEAPAGSEAEAAMRAALRDAVWEAAESHWVPGGEVLGEALLVSTDLSPDYLLAHFRRGMARRGFPDPGMILVVQASDRLAHTGIAADAEGWIRGAL